MRMLLPRGATSDEDVFERCRNRCAVPVLGIGRHGRAQCNCCTTHRYIDSDDDEQEGPASSRPPNAQTPPVLRFRCKQRSEEGDSDHVCNKGRSLESAVKQAEFSHRFWTGRVTAAFDFEEKLRTNCPHLWVNFVTRGFDEALFGKRRADGG